MENFRCSGFLSQVGFAVGLGSSEHMQPSIRGAIYILNQSINIGFVRIFYVRCCYFSKIHELYLENPKGRHLLGEAGVDEWIILK